MAVSRAHDPRPHRLRFHPDLARARTFYQGTLGLTLQEQTALALVFDANGTMLRVTEARDVDPPGYTVLGWRVADITRAIAAMSARGVDAARFAGLDQDEDGVWRTPSGDRVAWFRDPDGNVLSLTEFSQSGRTASTAGVRRP